MTLPSPSAPAGTPTDAAPTQSRLKTILGTGIGNGLEWYDWNIYASFAVYFSAQAFNPEDHTSDFLKTMAIFAVGFVARPFGGVVFGWLGDRVGRKHALSLAVMCASVGSLMIALLPTYGQVSVLSSLILLLARLIQGLAHGGEVGSAQTYIAEHAPRERRGLWASSIYVFGTSGLLVGLLFGLILQVTLTDDQMNTWGWRIPFLVGAVLGLVALWIRRSMEESDVFHESKQRQEAQGAKVRVFTQLVRNWKVSLQVILMTAGLTIAYYIWSVSMASLAKQSLGYTAQESFGASLIGNIVFIIALPLWGALSDRIGRKPCAIAGLAGSAILYIPMVLLVQGELWQLIVAISVQLVLLAGFLGHAPAMYAEMFSTSHRASGFGIPYAIAIAAFGGTAPMINTAIGDQLTFGIYAVIMLVVSIITLLTLRETAGRDLHEDEVETARAAGAL